MTSLGHVLRGGSPTAYDRVIATRFGVEAIDAVREGDFGKMVALRGTTVVRVPIEDGVEELKTVAARFAFIGLKLSQLFRRRILLHLGSDASSVV